MGATIEELSATVAALQAEVSRLRAKDELRDLVVTYARGCDQGNNPALLRPLFTDDATWECKGYGRYVGGDMVAKGLHAVAGNSIFWSLHNMISPQILNALFVALPISHSSLRRSRSARQKPRSL